MSAYSTITMSRKEALERLSNILEEQETTNEMLGDMLDICLAPSLYNAIVVGNEVMDMIEQERI